MPSIELNEDTNIIEHFRNRKEENPKGRKGKCFFVPVEEIKENDYDLSISKYKEIELCSSRGDP